MSREKYIIVGLLVLGALGVAVYTQAKRDEAIGKPAAGEAELPTLAVPEDIDKVSIQNGDKTEVVLQSVPDPQGDSDAGAAIRWVLTAPVKAEASQQAAKDLVANLKDLKAESQVRLHLDDEVRKDKQLDPAHAVHVVAWKGADKKLDALFGKSGAAGQLVVLSDKPDLVWAAKGYSAYLYTKEPKDFRDKEILKFDDGSASQVTIVNSHGTFSFTKGDNWAGTFDKKAIPRFDPEKVKDMLRAYKGLSADDFGDGKSSADTGLDKPDATVTIHLKDDAKVYELAVGTTASGTNRWAKRADGDLIYQITNYASEWAVSDESKYQASADAGASAGGDAGGKPTTAAKPKK
jgi:hypothetical protein